MPSHLHAQRVSFSYVSTVPVLDAVSFTLSAGWTGVVGANGSGKTTLFKLLARQLQPQEGRVLWEPANALVHLCRQDMEEPDGPVLDLAAMPDARALKLMARLGLEPDQVSRWPQLSAGERKRWQVGAALALEPDILLLDEPTNHLDGHTKDLLLGVLKRFPGVGVVVSHDRHFLDALTSNTLQVAHGRAELRHGNHGTAARAFAAEAAEAARQRAVLQQQKKGLETRLQQARQDNAAASLQRSAGRRMKSIHDSDARGLGADFRAASAQARLGRNVGTLRASLERVEEELDHTVVQREWGRSIHVPYERAPMPWLLGLEGEDVVRGERTILHKVSLRLGREDRVRITGNNGAGKSVLVEALLASSRLPKERVLVLPQELPPSQVAALTRDLRSFDRDQRGHVLTILASLGVDPVRVLDGGAPSPGEARKLALAMGLARSVWLVVMDEPTNTMDLPGVERVEAALKEHPGALLLVTHDVRFGEALTNTRWHVEGGHVGVSHDVPGG